MAHQDDLLEFPVAAADVVAVVVGDALDIVLDLLVAVVELAFELFDEVEDRDVLLEDLDREIGVVDGDEHHAAVDDADGVRI
ncbi:MAG: hypothetical protein MZW92_12555 [Comamonadaceae bacterium]|nr:hypothetical protein [Comamonadaceae bacterium]